MGSEIGWSGLMCQERRGEGLCMQQWLLCALEEWILNHRFLAHNLCRNNAVRQAKTSVAYMQNYILGITTDSLPCSRVLKGSFTIVTTFRRMNPML